VSEVLSGVLPVLATPFTENGDLDTASLASEIDFVIDQKAHGVVLGMVSEVLRLSSEERDRLTAETCHIVNGRVSVTTSVGAESLHTAVRHAKHADAVGADAVMAIPPMGTNCDDRELYQYYSGIIESIDIPVVVQDASGYLGRPLTIELQVNLFTKYGDRALFKPEAQPIGPRLSLLLEATGGQAKVYEGTGGLALVDSYKRGIVGTMPGPDIVWALVALWDALGRSDPRAAVRPGLHPEQPGLFRRGAKAPPPTPGCHRRHLCTRASGLRAGPADNPRIGPSVQPACQRGRSQGMTP